MVRFSPLNAHGSIAEAVAIRDGRIVYVGSNKGVVQFIGPSLRVTDLEGLLSQGWARGWSHAFPQRLKLQLFMYY